MKQTQFLIELKVYIARNFKNQREYAKHIGMDPSYLSMVFSNKRPPSKRMVADLKMVEIKYITRLYFKEHFDGDSK